MPEKRTFQGFPKGKIRLTPLPEQFFTEILPEEESADVLKIILYIFWALHQMDGSIRYLRLSEMEADEVLLAGMTGSLQDPIPTLRTALNMAVSKQYLLSIELPDDPEKYYFVNTERSRAILQLYSAGKWKPGLEKYLPISLDQVKPSIFQLFEQNIGLLTPLLADKLKLAEEEYPAEWLADAVGIAVENNIRKWSYIEAILKSWQERGKDDENRRNTQKDYSRYTEGEFARFIKH